MLIKGGGVVQHIIIDVCPVNFWRKGIAFFALLPALILNK